MIDLQRRFWRELFGINRSPHWLESLVFLAVLCGNGADCTGLLICLRRVTGKKDGRGNFRNWFVAGRPLQKGQWLCLVLSENTLSVESVAPCG